MYIFVYLQDTHGSLKELTCGITYKYIARCAIGHGFHVNWDTDSWNTDTPSGTPTTGTLWQQEHGKLRQWDTDNCDTWTTGTQKTETFRLLVVHLCLWVTIQEYTITWSNESKNWKQQHNLLVNLVPNLHGQNGMIRPNGGNFFQTVPVFAWWHNKHSELFLSFPTINIDLLCWDILLCLAGIVC